ncbi:MAG: hypothetical protein R2708_15070 [Vicinamibacterales bacterium]
MTQTVDRSAILTVLVSGPMLTGEGAALENHARKGRVHRQRSLDLAALRECRDLLVGDVPQTQAIPRRFEQGVRAAAGLGELALPELLLSPQREQILALSGNQVGTVDGQEGLASPHALADVVDEHLLDPTADLGMNLGDPCLVVGDGADGTNRPVERLVPDHGGSDADGLLARR